MTMPSVVCPRCASPSVQAVPLEQRSVAAAALSEEFLGTAAGVVAGTRRVLVNHCLGCGWDWLPGSEEERRLRALNGQLGEDAKEVEFALVEEERRVATKAQQSRLRRSHKIVALAVVLLTVALIANAMLR